MKTVLILEEDGFIRNFAADALRRAGYTVLEAASGKELSGRMENHPELDGVILSVCVNDEQAAQLCRFIRQQRPQIGILVTADDPMGNDAVTALMDGADQVLAMPYSPYGLCDTVDKLLARNEKLLPQVQNVISHGPFLLDMHACVLEKMGQVIALTQREYSTIRLFMENPGRILTHQDIYAAAWKDSGRADRKAVEQVIHTLRLKLEEDPAAPQYLRTEWGYGYQWCPTA